MKLSRSTLSTTIFLTSLITLIVFSILVSGKVNVGEDWYEYSVTKLYKDVLFKIGEMRGLAPPEDAKIRIVSIKWFIEQAKANYQTESEETIREELIYKSLFLIPQNFSLRDIRVEEASMILAAVSGDTLYVVREYFNPYDEDAARRTLAHEVTHIIQGTFFKQPQINSHDENQAWLALIEGDADFTADMYKQSLAYSKTKIFSALSEAEYNYGIKIPESINQISGFPYNYGENFVKTLFTSGGWMQVNNAYTKLPTSTTQIMHPEKYIYDNKSGAIKINQSNIIDWEKVYSDTYGEHFISIVLSNWIPLENANRASEGWMGDNYILYMKGEQYMFSWKLIWESFNDAYEFYISFEDLRSYAVGPNTNEGFDI